MDTERITRIFKQIDKFRNIDKGEIQISSGLSSLCRVRANGEEYCLKSVISKEMGDSELDGLNALREMTPNVPEAFGTAHDKNEYFIILEYIENTTLNKPGPIFETMRSVYSCKGDYWGWRKDNFVGTLPQKNSPHKDFISYFMRDRIEPLLRLTHENDLLERSLKDDILSLIYKKSADWSLGKITPRLIHGDLWSGNLLQAKNGKVYLIDPSVSFGHPEQDFAMSLLFGGVHSGWIEPIAEELQLENGFSERVPFWQIYPLLVHVRLFGGGYIESLKRAVHYY